jgi:hypothetical protein
MMYVDTSKNSADALLNVLLMILNVPLTLLNVPSTLLHTPLTFLHAPSMVFKIPQTPYVVSFLSKRSQRLPKEVIKSAENVLKSTYLLTRA